MRASCAQSASQATPREMAFVMVCLLLLCPFSLLSPSSPLLSPSLLSCPLSVSLLSNPPWYSCVSLLLAFFTSPFFVFSLLTECTDAQAGGFILIFVLIPIFCVVCYGIATMSSSKSGRGAFNLSSTIGLVISYLQGILIIIHPFNNIERKKMFFSFMSKLQPFFLFFHFVLFVILVLAIFGSYLVAWPNVVHGLFSGVSFITFNLEYLRPDCTVKTSYLSR